MNEETSQHSSSEFHIAGVGASAGGLEALEDFFKAMPLDTGIAFVVVQHLSPDFKSHMEQLLSRKTDLPVSRAKEGMEVEPNHIYLIPAKKDMVILEGRLLLTDRTKNFSLPIDDFLQSLANDAGERAIAIILSGTGSDGSNGIQHIASTGGLVLCQDENSAKFDGMPHNAVATGAVNVVTTPEEMPELLVQYVQEGLSPDELAERELLEASTGIEKIFAALKEHAGVDFAYYKSGMIGRRIQRRMSLEQIIDVDQYYQKLTEDPEELDDLYHDLLIGVTQFFRDEEAYKLLQDDVIPELFSKAKIDQKVLRVWVAACATGEEAYSIAILLQEHIRKHDLQMDFKLFATDIHKGALEKAALGAFSEESVEGMDPEYLDRYLRKRKSQYHIVPGLRQKVVFANHNVLYDAPFTQLDLITCRNMMIYLLPSAQRKTLSLFHFGLKAGGVLFLGPSETPGELIDEFRVIDKRWRIYRKRRNVRLPMEPRIPIAGMNASSPESKQLNGRRQNSSESILTRTYERLLAENMPPSILVDDKFDLLHTFSGAERFLLLRGGRHSSNLLDVVEKQLRTPIAGALTQAEEKAGEVKYSGIWLGEGEDAEQLRILVKPVHDHITQVTTYLIRFEPMAIPPLKEVRIGETGGSDVAVNMSALSEERISALESELRFSRENLQSTIEELETANEELQATNEEMVASNEELQSTNEELQSVNEELYTVNSEHQKRIDELAEATNDMDNLLATTRVGVIFIDDEMCLRRFTPEIGRMFHLLPQDVGRPIRSIGSWLEYKSFDDDLKVVLASERELERSITDRKGTPFIARMMPYRTVSGVTGVVLTLIDVRVLRSAQKDLEQFRHMSEAAIDVHAFVNGDGKLVYSNPALAKASGKTVEDLSRLSLSDLDQDMTDERLAEIIKASRHGDVPLYEWDLHGPNGTIRLEASVSGVEIGGKWMIFVIGRDITKRATEKTELLESKQLAEAANQSKSIFLANMSHEIRTPLSPILGFAEALETSATTPEQAEQAKLIRRNGEHLLSIVNDVLDLSKIEANKMDIELESVETVALMNEVYSLMVIRAEDKAIPLHLKYTSKIPKRIETDPVRFRQIMLNLVGNAIKFTDSGSVEIVVSFDTPNLVVAIHDTGVGIAASDQELLFQPFTQADSTIQNRVGGTGLGLTICRRLIEVLGGEIELKSTIKKGSCFTIKLPVKDPENVELVDGEAGQESSESALVRTYEGLDGYKILVADDRRDVWLVARHFLERAGATVKIASDGQEAVDMVEQSDDDKFDLVFMDMQMPVLNGHDAVRELRKMGFEMPIVALTAAAMKGEKQACLAAGCDEYLTKPIESDLLIGTARRLIEEKRE
ncbi:ATP-binding protein [Mariniblastus sp.]|nr:ATP-binding protein [Mariniblastus sp.]